MTGLLMGNSSASSSRRSSSSSVTLTSLGNHHHHHPHQGFQANRCRADSGSTYSSSDTSNRSKTSSRRRSHRPRGCRGGSSRKKRRGGTNNKVPKEIGGTATVEDDISVNVNTKGDVSSNVDDPVSSDDSSNKTTLEIARETTSSSSKIKRKTLLQPGETRNSQKLSVSFADDENRHHQMITISDENAGRSSTHQPFNSGNLKYLPLTSNSAAVYGENNNKNDALPPPMMMMKAKNSNNSATSRASSNSCLPPLQESMKSFLAASKEQQRPPPPPPPPSSISSINPTFPATDQLKASASNVSGFSQSQILPPLYHPEPAVHPSQEPNLRGPNIYALQGSHHHHNTTTRTHASHRDNSTSTNTNTNYCRNNNNGILTSAATSGSNNNNKDNIYNAYTDYHGRSHQLYGYDNHSSNYSKYGATTLLPMQQRSSSSSHSGVGSNTITSQYGSSDDEDSNSSSRSNNYESDFPHFQHYSHADRRAEKLHQEPLPPVIKHSSNFLSHNHHNKVRTTTTASSIHNKTPGTSYRIERIEKQRQMMAEGGSLFVTSPKSFLMGWKSDDMPRM